MDKRQRRQKTLIDRVRRELVARRILLRKQGMPLPEITQSLQPMRDLLASLQQDLLTRPTISLH